jgi:transcriptional repressor NrdR
MHCPFCAHDDTKVNDSRLAAEGTQIRRRRECLACGERFTTFETAELVMPLVVKNDQRRVPFDENKLRGGLHKSLEKRPVSRESIEEAVGHITRKLRSLGEREVTSRQIGEIVMEELHKLDEVAYVRYASVYRHFQDVEAFREEVDRLRHRRGKLPSEDQLSLLPGELLPKETWQGAQVKFSAFDEAAMRRALELAQRGLYSTHPNPRVGAVLARDEEIVGEGWHERAGEPHAEPIAIRAAGDRARGATAYVTLEPCAPDEHRRVWMCCSRPAYRVVYHRRSESARQRRGRAPEQPVSRSNPVVRGRCRSP